MDSRYVFKAKPARDSIKEIEVTYMILNVFIKIMTERFYQIWKNEDGSVSKDLRDTMLCVFEHEAKLGYYPVSKLIEGGAGEFPSSYFTRVPLYAVWLWNFVFKELGVDQKSIDNSFNSARFITNLRRWLWKQIFLEEISKDLESCNLGAFLNNLHERIESESCTKKQKSSYKKYKAIVLSLIHI